MARLQILELPEGSSDDRPPFVLVVDQVPRNGLASNALRRDLADNDIATRTGARAVLVFEDTIDIPANDVAVDQNGQPLFHVAHIEGDTERIRTLVQDEIRRTQGKITDALRGVR